MKSKTARSAVSVMLALVLSFSLLPSFSGAKAVSRTIVLQQAQNLAIARSSDLTKKRNEIILKQMKYVESVDGIKAKVKNLKSFRWSPLLSFKFPQQLDLVEDYELNVKPLNLQTEIDTLRHELNDIRLRTLADVNKQYTELYILQEKIAFTQRRLDGATQELTQNEARMSTGLANQADVDKMRSSVDALTTELSNLKSSMESGKAKLTDLIGLDVTSGYTFKNSLKSLSLPREQLSWVTQYALSNDHTYYIAKTAASTALLNLNSYVDLMREQYGDKMNYIMGFVNQAKQGQDIDYAAFKMKYQQMITAVDKPWNKSIRILFFRFTLEWFKGAIDGSRYIEDEMYAVYTAAMEYGAAEKERASAEKELRSTISESYDTLITQYKSYEAVKKNAELASTKLDQVIVLNKTGKADYEEVKDARENYESMQLEMVDALATYNDLLYEFDRQTCGAITIYMKGAGVSVDSGGGGDSFAKLDPISDPYYYIYNKVADMTFSIGVSIPDSFMPSIDQYEVWIGETQIGVRTETGKEITHLALDYADVSTLLIRLYNGDEFVCECEIDASIPRDVLPIERESVETPTEKQIGTYKVDTAPIGSLSTSELSLKLNSDIKAATYSITYGEHGAVSTTEKLPTDKPLSCLTILIASLADVTLTLYDDSGEVLYTARFDTEGQTIMASLINE